MWNNSCKVIFSCFVDFLHCDVHIGCYLSEVRRCWVPVPKPNVDEERNKCGQKVELFRPDLYKAIAFKVCPAFLPRSFRQPMWTNSGRNVDEKWKQCGRNVETMWTECGRNVERKWPHCAVHFFFWKLCRFHRVCRLTMVTNRCKPYIFQNPRIAKPPSDVR